MRVGAREYAPVQPETLGDRESVRRARQSDPQTEGRSQRVRVELHARVADAGCVEREGLQLWVVRRRGDEYATLEQRFEHSHRERCALVRIRTGADLIEQREVASLGIREGRDRKSTRLNSSH